MGLGGTQPPTPNSATPNTITPYPTLCADPDTCAYTTDYEVLSPSPTYAAAQFYKWATAFDKNGSELVGGLKPMVSCGLVYGPREATACTNRLALTPLMKYIVWANYINTQVGREVSVRATWQWQCCYRRGWRRGMRGWLRVAAGLRRRRCCWSPARCQQGRAACQCCICPPHSP